MYTHRIPGLNYTPLTEYLAALGLHKVIASQADPAALGGWVDDTFTVQTTLDDIPSFLVTSYAPSPILSPWTNGSGFGEKDKTPKVFIDLLESSTTSRLSAFRDALAAIRTVLRMPGAIAWRTDKGRFVQELRNWLPDDSLGWMDASVVLTGTGPAFPPILGTGGNDGRLDFSTNFHQRLAEVLPELGAKPARSAGWARDMLAGVTRTPLVSASIGQGDASAAGGPGTSIYGAADSIVNPWLYVLMIEGATLFASSAARRYGEQHGRAAMPFTVQSSPDGPIPGASNEPSRGELWAPVFGLLALSGVRQILQEARATWDGGSAQTVPAMYGALRTYGVDRGINKFQRFGFLQRNGLSFVATPLDTVEVVHRPEVVAAQTPLRRSRVFSHATGAASEQASHRFAASATAFIRDPSWSAAIAMLARQTAFEVTATRSQSNRDALRNPGRLASVNDVLPVVVDLLHHSQEARIAAGIASGLARSYQGLVTPRTLLVGSDPGQSNRPAVVSGIGARAVTDVLADMMVWLAQHPGEDDKTARGWLPWVSHRYPTGWTEVHAWVGGLLDEQFLGECLLAFLAVDWYPKAGRAEFRRQSLPIVHVDPALALLQALASGRGRVEGHSATDARGRRGLDASWPSQLRANQVGIVGDQAAGTVQRTTFVSAGGQLTTFRPVAARDGLDLAAGGPRILAGLAAPASLGAIRHITPSTSERQPIHEGELS